MQTDFTATFDTDRWLRWRVKARNDQGWGRWTDWWWVGVDTTAPTNPALITETHGTQDDAWTRQPPSFSWSDADDGTGSGVAGYYVYFGNDAGGRPNWWTYDPAWSPPTSGSGVYYLRGYAQDRLGHHPRPSTWFTFKYDVTPPQNPASATETHGVGDGVWQRDVDDPAYTWTPGFDAHSGLAGYDVYFGPDAVGTSTTFVDTAVYDPPAVPGSGEYYLRLRARDAVDNTAPWRTYHVFRYDVTSPTLTLTPLWTTSEWYSTTVVLRADADDEHSGMSVLTVDGEDFTASPVYKVISRTESGVYVIPALARDAVGNERAGSVEYKYDAIPPVLEFTEVHGLANGVCQTSVSQPTFAYTATDAHSGPSHVVVLGSLGSEVLGATGRHTVEYTSSVSDTILLVGYDGVGWSDDHSFTFCYVDPDEPGAGQPTTPTLEIEWPDDDRVGGGCHSGHPIVVPVVGGGLVFGASYLEQYEVEVWYTGMSGVPVRLEHRYLPPAEAVSWRPVTSYPGHYTLKVRARALFADGVRISSEWVTASFCIDGTPPPAPAPVDLCGLESGEWTNRECLRGTWGAVADWPSGLDHYTRCFGRGVCTPTVTTALTGTSWTAGDIIGDGEYRLRVTATDRVGNTSGVGEFIYLLDRVPPTLSEVAPPPAVVSNTVSVAWSSGDERSGVDLHRLRFYRADTGSPVLVRYLSGPIRAWDGDTALLDETGYTMTLEAVDRAGNASPPLRWRIDVDRTPPTITGGEVEWEPAQSPAFTAVVTATDAHGIIRYRWRAGDISGETAGPVWSASPVAEGTYTVEVQVVDEVGNASAWESVGTAVYDVTPPDPEPPEPPAAPEGATNDPTFTLSYDPDVAYWTFGVDPTGEVFTTTVPPTEYTLPPATSGVYTVTVQACDEYGNCTDPGWVYTVVFDNAPPVVAVQGPDGWVATTHLEYTVVVTDDMDPNPLLWYCRGEGCEPAEPLTGEVIVWDVDSSGRYTVTVEAIDDAHNAGTAEGWASVDVTPPVVEGLTTNAEEWQRETRVARFTWTAYDLHSGIGGFDAVVEGPDVVTVALPAETTSYTANPVPEGWEGEVVFHLRARDRSEPWQYSGWADAVFRYDGRPPAVTALSSVGEGWQNGASHAVVQVEATDGGSGTADVRYCAAAGECSPVAAVPEDGVVIQGQSEVPVHLRVRAEDALGNVITETIYTLRYDADPPRLQMSGLPGTTRDPTITVTSSVTDVAVVEAALLLLRGGEEVDRCTAVPGTCAPVFAGEGEYTVRLTAVDAAGNEARLDDVVVYDPSAPSVVLDAPDRVSVAAASFEVTWTVGEDAVGWRFFADGEERLSGSGTGGNATVQVSPVTGTIVLRVEAWDLVGNVGFDEDTVEIVADYDEDGIPDLWETAHGLDWQSAADASADNDADGLTNLEEYRTGCCDPQDPDSDNDGLSDGDEVHTHGTDPCDSDTDDDGLSDGWEVEHGTDPLTPTSTDEQVAVEAAPGEQTVGVGQVAHVAVTVHNLGQIGLSSRVTATFPGGFSPDGDEAGWTVESGRAYRQVNLAPGADETYGLPLVYDGLGDKQVTASILAATAAVTVHVVDSSWLVLESVEHPAEAHPEQEVAVRTQLRNVSDVLAPGVALRVRLGKEESAYIRDLAARELWVQETGFAVPGWSAFPNAATASLPVEVEGAQGYAGEVAVVGPRFDIEGDVEQGIGVVTYTLKATNSGNRSGPLVARLTWAAGRVEEVLDGDGDVWIDEDGALIWQVNEVPVGEVKYARVVVFASGVAVPMVETEPGWVLGEVDLPAAGIRIWRIYLPLVIREVP